MKNTRTLIKIHLKGSKTAVLQRPNQSTELNHVQTLQTLARKEFREAGIAGSRNRPRVLKPPVMLQ